MIICIDGTLIRIYRLTKNETNFVDRLGNHSLNYMAMCDPDCSFYHVCARWLGSVNDARVLRNSSVILGDYPLKDWLIPLLNDIQDPAVIAFNRAHKSIRRIVGNSFGTLKEKFVLILCLLQIFLNVALCNI